MRALCIITVIVLLFTSVITVFPGVISASDIISVDNTITGDMVAFSQNYSALATVPENMQLINPVIPFNTIINSTLDYDLDDRCVLYNASYQSNGRLFIGGFMPAPDTTYSMTIGYSRTNWNQGLNIFIGDARIAVQLRGGDPQNLRLTSYWYDSAGVFKNQAIDTADYWLNHFAANGTMDIDVVVSGTDDICQVYLDGVLKLTTPLYQYGFELNEINTPFIMIYPTGTYAGSYAVLKLYSITQTIDSYHYVTPIGNSNVQPFGLDGPHDTNNISDGIAYMVARDGAGTIWADIGYVSDTNIPYIKSLLANGWELGIHFSSGLNTLSYAQAKALIDDEVEQITALFGQQPTSWCSLQNADNNTHAIYAYQNYGMAYRNSYCGIKHITNVGNLEDEVWSPFYQPLSEGGIVYPTFTHQTDPDPAVLFSISFSNFTDYVDNYQTNGIRLVGYYEYWSIAQNVAHTIISGATLKNDSYLSFDVDNIGGNSRLFVAAPFAELVIDENGNEVNFTVTDGGIILEVEAGEYQIMTKSYYRQLQVDNAISPIFIIIPFVVIFSVIQLVTGLGRKLR